MSTVIEGTKAIPFILYSNQPQTKYLTSLLPQNKAPNLTNFIHYQLKSKSISTSFHSYFRMSDSTVGEIRREKDPTKAILSQSGLNDKYLCDYVINVATGCSHGCKFCYVPSTPNIRTRPDMLADTVDVDDPQKEWGSYVLYRDEIPEKLPGILDRKRKWKSTKKGCGIVGVSFATDCYMDRRAGDITTNVVNTLSNHNKYTRILTRNPMLAANDMETYIDADEYVTVGSSINSLNADAVGAIEVNAPSPQQRLKGLQKFAENDVTVYVSMSPTYPTMSERDIRELLSKLATLNPDVVFHEPINPRGGNFQMTIDAAWAAGEDELGASLAKLKHTENWVEYALNHFYWVQQAAIDIGVPIHLWPDKELQKYATGDTNRWITEWIDRQSIEGFANRQTPQTSLPALPEELTYTTNS